MIINFNNTLDQTHAASQNSLMQNLLKLYFSKLKMHFLQSVFFVVLSIFDHKITFKNAFHRMHVITQVKAKDTLGCGIMNHSLRNCQIFLEKVLTLRRLSNSFLEHRRVTLWIKWGNFGQLQGDNFDFGHKISFHAKLHLSEKLQKF